MSLYDKASLIQIPSLYKDGLLVSTVPEDRSGDFTFSRGSNLSATRVKEDGYIEKGYENLLTYSNQFDNTWLQNRIDLTSGQSGYDGGSDAWKLESNNASTTYLSQGVAVSGVQTTSLYAKAGTADYFAYYTSSGASAWFNLSNGSIGNAGSNIDTQIEDVGNGWYRCSMSYNASISYVRIYLTDANGSFISAVGSNIYIQDAQINQGLAALPYVESGATKGKAGVLESTPRIDFTGGTPSLLLEPSRTNLLPYSEYFGSGWTLSNITANYNNSTSPEGLQNATNLVPNTSNGGHRMYLSFTASGDVTASIYVKPNGYSKIGIQNNAVGGGQYFTFDIVTLSKLDGNETDYGYETAANGFIRLWVVMPAGTPLFGYFLYVLNDSYTTGNPGLYSFAGDGTSGVLTYALQAEQGSFKTSYIPTYGVSQTRAADVANNLSIPNTPSFWSCLIDVDFSKTPLVSNITFFNTITTSGVMSWRFFNRNGVHAVAPYFEASASYAFGSNEDNNRTDGSVLLRHNGGGSYTYFRSYLGVVTQTTATGLTETNLNQINFNGNDTKWASSQILVFPTALTDSECIALTTIT